MSILVTKCSRLLRFGSRPSVKLLKAVIGIAVPFVSQLLTQYPLFIRGPPLATPPSALPTGFIQMRTNKAKLTGPRPPRFREKESPHPLERAVRRRHAPPLAFAAHSSRSVFPRCVHRARSSTRCDHRAAY